MVPRPLYQAVLVILVLATATGGVWLIVDPSSSPGVEVTLPGPLAAPHFQAAPNQLSSGAPSGLIDINSASVEDLETLPNIGPVLAQRIVDYREEQGLFTRIDEVMAVYRIGPAIYESIRELVTVEP